jgi:hypothetical protein
MMNWFKKHLHLTWLFYMIVSLPVVGLVLMFIFGLDGRTAGSIGAYMWLMLTPFPVNLWILHQKKRSWAWSLFTLWTLCWFPLVIGNKNPDRIIKKSTLFDSTPSQTPESGHSDGYNETHAHSDKTVVI